MAAQKLAVNLSADIQTKILFLGFFFRAVKKYVGLRGWLLLLTKLSFLTSGLSFTVTLQLLSPQDSYIFCIAYIIK